LADHKINILDISQTIVSGYFNMMMITDIVDADIDFLSIQNGLDAIGKEIGCQIKTQDEAIFDMMHRI
jgi:ACT domain-containing protein